MGRLKEKRSMVKKSLAVHLNESPEAMPVAMLVLSVFALIGNTYNPFLYFQF